MEIYRCECCQQQVFFSNTHCLHCGSVLAYLPDRNRISALNQGEDGQFHIWGNPDPAAAYRLCANTAHQVCNWAIPAEDPHALCASCRLTAIIPNLQRPGYAQAWARLEAAKRRALRELMRLGLPIPGRADYPENGLVFEWKSTADTPDNSPVLTGHDHGCIVISLDEVDDVERLRRRIDLGEAYRTLLGHMRHEIGHYYWDILIANTDNQDSFRAMFGDERQDYGQALEDHYQHGAPENWQNDYISTYASCHPWEDWAETWAHYMHITSTLESMRSTGLDVLASQPDSPVHELAFPPAASGDISPFRAMIAQWLALSLALNMMNRSLGKEDAYPFVLSEAVIHKLEYVHDLIARTEPVWPPGNA